MFRDGRERTLVVLSRRIAGLLAGRDPPQARRGAQISADELISWIRDRLAPYKCPVGVTFAASLARTASGKLQKQAIRSSLGPRPVP